MPTHAAKVRKIHTVVVKLHAKSPEHEGEQGSEGHFKETVHVINANNADEAIWYVKEWAQGLLFEHPDTCWMMAVDGAKTVSVEERGGGAFSSDRFRLAVSAGDHFLLSGGRADAT
jgi:hypothetical protein